MRSLITLSLIITSFLAVAQNDTTYWKMGGLGSITFSQVSLSNWAGGGQNSSAVNAKFIYSAIRTKDRSVWENRLDLGYGVIKQGSADLDKSDDKLSFYTKYDYRVKKDNSHWFIDGLADFKTQFDEGFEPDNESILISDFMAPGYLTVGTGVEYKANEKLNFTLNPLTGKFTFVQVQILADSGAFGVEPAVLDVNGNVITPGKNARAEIGAFFRATYTTPIFESRLELFTNYTENFGNIDVNWQNTLVVNVTKIITMNLYTELIYDDDIKITDSNGENPKPRTQFKSVVGIGLAYRFGAKVE